MDLNEALNNEEIAKKFEDAKDMKDILNILKEAGVETTEEEVLKLLPSLDDELTDENLEDVAGGSRGNGLLGKFGIGLKVLWILIKSGKIPVPIGGPIKSRW